MFIDKIYVYEELDTVKTWKWITIATKYLQNLFRVSLQQWRGEGFEGQATRDLGYAYLCWLTRIRYIVFNRKLLDYELLRFKLYNRDYYFLF